MTMLSFRVAEGQAVEIQSWADRRGVGRSDLMREAVRRYLLQLAGEVDPETWQRQPLCGEEAALTEIADWGPAEDWNDWADAAR